MRSVFLASAFVFVAVAAPAEAQLAITSEDAYQYVNNQSGNIYTGGDNIKASFQLAVENDDPQNSYTMYVLVEIDDSSGNRVASAMTSFTASKAQDVNTPTISTGGLSCSYTVPQVPNEDHAYTATCYVWTYINGIKDDVGEPDEVYFNEG